MCMHVKLTQLVSILSEHIWYIIWYNVHRQALPRRTSLISHNIALGSTCRSTCTCTRTYVVYLRQKKRKIVHKVYAVIHAYTCYVKCNLRHVCTNHVSIYIQDISFVTNKLFQSVNRHCTGSPQDEPVGLHVLDQVKLKVSMCTCSGTYNLINVTQR